MSPHTRHTITAQRSCEPRRKPPPVPPTEPPPPPPLNTRAEWHCDSWTLPSQFWTLNGITEDVARTCGAWLCNNGYDFLVKLNWFNCDELTNTAYNYLGFLACAEDGPWPEPAPGPDECTEPEDPPPCPGL